MRGWKDDQIDERAIKYLHRDWTKPEGQRYDWNSSCGAMPTLMLRPEGVGYGLPVCAYCGRQGLTLQRHIRTRGDYSVTGHACICKDALDSLDIQESIEELEKKHEQEMRELKRKIPTVNKEVIKRMMEDQFIASMKAIERGGPFDMRDSLDAYNIRMVTQEEM